MRIITLLVLVLSLSSCRYNEYSFYRNTYSPERLSLQSSVQLGKVYIAKNAGDFKLQEVEEVRNGVTYNYFILHRTFVNRFDVNLTFPITREEISEIANSLKLIKKDIPNSGEEYKFYKNIVTNGDEFLIIDGKLKYGEFKLRFIFSQDLKSADFEELLTLASDDTRTLLYQEMANKARSRYQYEDPRDLDGLIDLFNLKE